MMGKKNKKGTELGFYDDLVAGAVSDDDQDFRMLVAKANRQAATKSNLILYQLSRTKKDGRKVEHINE